MGPPEGVLCLPGPAFSYDYARGALAVHGVPLTVHQDGGQARALPHSASFTSLPP